jgi:hypothetical protein
MSDREIIFRVYFKCGGKYEFIVNDNDGFNATLETFWDMAALWCEGVCVDTVGWLHSMLSQETWVPKVNDNDILCPPSPGMRDFYDQPDTFVVDAAYVLTEFLGANNIHPNNQEVIVQYKDGKLTRLDNPIVRFANKLSPSF